MNNYKHTQRGTVIIVAMLILFVIFLVLGIFVAHEFFITAPLLLLGVCLFGTLTIEIADGELRWHFGPGLIRKHVALADIATARVVRTNFLEGWGIHYSRFGWLYNVSGFDAVAVTLHDGKRFALGTNEPEVLTVKLVATNPPA